MFSLCCVILNISTTFFPGILLSNAAVQMPDTENDWVERTKFLICSYRNAKVFMIIPTTTPMESACIHGEFKKDDIRTFSSRTYCSQFNNPSQSANHCSADDD